MTAHFTPNVGGVETHLDDLCRSLVEREFQVTVLTYRPLQTKARWQILEKGKNIEIIRIPWIPDLFYRLVSLPILEFLYLLPGIFLILPFIILSKKIEVIHAHGLVAGFTGVFWGKIFNKRVVISLHSIYCFPKVGIYRDFVTWIFKHADYVFGLSKQSVGEIKSLGISSKKVGQFTYWIDLKNFKKIDNARKQLGWKDNFIVLFVGRLVPEKGIDILLKAVRMWDKKIVLKICGTGPLEGAIELEERNLSNIKYLGSINQNKLPVYYSGSDILVVPSVSEEGFGRVILEALACGLPVVGTNQGAIPEAMDRSVGKLIDINPGNIKSAIEFFYNNKAELRKLANNCRKFAERRFSEKNVETIIRSYSK